MGRDLRRLLSNKAVVLGAIGVIGVACTAPAVGTNMQQQPSLSPEAKNTQLSSRRKSVAVSPPAVKQVSPAAVPAPDAQLVKADSTKTGRGRPTPPPVAPGPDVYQVNEQFTGTALDTSLWEAVTYPKGYRNSEEQDYKPSQVSVGDGVMKITANRDASGAWHSGEVHSKWNYTYGEFEVRMAVPVTAPGVWPAAWLMGTTDQWPNNGELDFMEHINSESTVYGTIHGGGSKGHWQLQSYFAPIDVTQYHTYKMVKQPGIISWWIDGVKRAEWSQSQTPASGIWPFENHRNFGLLNLAIGGTWPGPSNSSTPGTITMMVDYYTVKNGS